MNIGTVFAGFRVDQIVRVPDGGCLTLGYFLNGSVEPNNHNIFRLDKDGNVIWQIQRNENGILKWDMLHKHAKERGQDGARWPFENLLVVRPGDIRHVDPLTGAPLAVDTWEPGCRVFSDSAQGYSYEIDIERGIARNRADTPQRPW